MIEHHTPNPAAVLVGYRVVADSGEQSPLYEGPDALEQAHALRDTWIDGSCVADFVHVAELRLLPSSAYEGRRHPQTPDDAAQ